MADFKTHLLVGASTSSLAATSLMVVDLVTPREVALLAGLGTAASLLPDMDADASVPVKFFFALFAVVCGFAVVVRWMDGYSVLELVVVWLGVFLLIRFGLFHLFARLTVHRGVWHSMPAGLLFGFLSTAALYSIASQPPLQAWFGGAFVFFGYLTHLVLDELSSVDLWGVTCRRSFGSALKLFSLRNKKASAALYLATFLAFYLTPPVNDLTDVLLDPSTYQQIRVAFLPTEGWFNR
jgi:hypothetical protein